MMVDQAARDPGLLTDLIDGKGSHAALAEACNSGVDQFCAPLLRTLAMISNFF
jgi:hypothetical protein